MYSGPWLIVLSWQERYDLLSDTTCPACMTALEPVRYRPCQVAIHPGSCPTAGGDPPICSRLSTTSPWVLFPAWKNDLVRKCLESFPGATCVISSMQSSSCGLEQWKNTLNSLVRRRKWHWYILSSKLNKRRQIKQALHAWQRQWFDRCHCHNQCIDQLQSWAFYIWFLWSVLAGCDLKISHCSYTQGNICSKRNVVSCVTISFPYGMYIIIGLLYLFPSKAKYSLYLAASRLKKCY